MVQEMPKRNVKHRCKMGMVEKIGFSNYDPIKAKFVYYLVACETCRRPEIEKWPLTMRKLNG